MVVLLPILISLKRKKKKTLFIHRLPLKLKIFPKHGVNILTNPNPLCIRNSVYNQRINKPEGLFQHKAMKNQLKRIIDSTTKILKLSIRQDLYFPQYFLNRHLRFSLRKKKQIHLISQVMPLYS